MPQSMILPSINIAQSERHLFNPRTVQKHDFCCIEKSTTGALYALTGTHHQPCSIKKFLYQENTRSFYYQQHNANLPSFKKTQSLTIYFLTANILRGRASLFKQKSIQKSKNYFCAFYYSSVWSKPFAKTKHEDEVIFCKVISVRFFYRSNFPALLYTLNLFL